MKSESQAFTKKIQKDYIIGITTWQIKHTYKYMFLWMAFFKKRLL